MISIIICSRKADIPEELKQNIAETIGCEYELCVIDNSRDEYNIFTAYNEGVRRAKGDVLCFMHEDVLFRCEGWGKIIKNQLADKTIGIIGFGGAHFLPSVPMYWSEIPFISEYCQHNDNGIIKECICTDYFSEDIADVCVVDGFCMFVPRHLFAKIKFDDSNYSNYHAYDMDICMQVLQEGYRVCVSRSILVEHFWSEDIMQNKNYSRVLDKNMQIFQNKWRNQLPICRGMKISPVIILRLNNLCAHAYDSRTARQSLSYRIGRAILTPIKMLLKS